ncbi:hypothetical protein D9M68_571550 [compost metagenome]
MKKNYLYLLISVIAVLFSCKKESMPSLIGTWLSENPLMQLPIKNTNGEGKNVSFRVDSTSAGNYLIMVRNADTSIFLIRNLSKDTLVLQSSDTTYTLRRIKDL